VPPGRLTRTGDASAGGGAYAPGMDGRASALAVAAVLLLPAAASPAPTTPHAQARASLRGCLGALRAVPFAAAPSTGGLPHSYWKARTASIACNLVPSLAALSAAHRTDKALQDAYGAGLNLTMGIGEYVQYLGAAAFGRQNRAVLRRARRDIASGKAAARKALPELR
jgi:hypothetical protein